MTIECHNVVSLESFRAKKPVKPICSGHWIGPGWAVTFAYVLNVPVGVDLWPGDAADLFFPDMFALRLSDEYGLYILDNYVHEHMRCEILRLCSGRDLSWYDPKGEIEFYCRMEAAFASMLSDGCEDELFDTLDSELLLTQEYQPPEGH